MTKIRRVIAVGLTGIAMVLVAGAPSFADDLGSKSCAELVEMAANYQQDLATVDKVLGSAIDAGTLNRIRSYKLRKAAVKQQLNAVLRVIQLKDCTVPE